ncbi:DUF1398 family protein [Hydrogenophaga sp.]|uniref:DUF1398 family protein n=1 Tax=Hydrogenophaga sp. TaxID=1904254 RepID=UPI002603FEA7|nr:DUF1398 family protein [Hydrogenophaga sp.]MCW5655265.1 DUF1398 family protein [Hydrogenophaga sp.]
MNEHTRATLQATFDASNQGRLHFGEVVGRLMEVQVESYHVDYRAGRATCYLPDGATLDLGFDRSRPEDIPDAFDAAAVRAAILGAQQGRVMYPEFKRLSQRAGCTGYTVWIAGRHVTYFGRKGETHTEPFPD